MEEQSVLDFVVGTIRWLINPRRFARPRLEPDEAETASGRAAAVVEAQAVPEAGVEETGFPAPVLEGEPAPAEEIPARVAPRAAPRDGHLRAEEVDEERGRRFGDGVFPWRAALSLLTAVWAQVSLEPPDRSPKVALALYAVSALLLVWAVLRREWVLLPPREDSKAPMSMAIRPQFLWFTLVLVAVLMILFGGNQFNPVNLFVWVTAIYYLVRALAIGKRKDRSRPLTHSLAEFFKNPVLNLQVSAWHVLVLLAVLVVVFFRFYRLGGVPGEMFSDHAEKLLDVSDVLSGLTSIFFPRNTGREAFQMYLTAAVALVFKTGLTFMSLKIGTALAGLFTLPYIYKLGKEVGNKWVGLLALLLAGVAYWPNLISRIGLRFPLYPLFVAPVLFYLVRGIRTSNRKDMILAGIALGLGLHGYSPMRIVPFVILILIGLYLLHPQARGKRASILVGTVVLAVLAFMVFLPLFRYMLDDPEMFGLRAFSRLGTTERPFPGPVWQIFFGNLGKAMIMFFWDNGGIWVHSVVGHPALDVVSAALLFAGMALLLIRYIRQRNWIDLWLLVSIPLLMMPSILSLAFPDENPSLNRTGGAIIPVFIIAAIALESLLAGIAKFTRGSAGKVLSVLVGVGLLTGSALQNYNLVFVQFDRQFMAGAWNTSEIGHVIKAFGESVGSPESAYVVPYPYWVDTRLVGINAGFPLTDYALWPESFSETLSETRAKLFILKPEDQESLDTLKAMYPSAVSWTYPGEWEGKDFVLLFVPMQADAVGQDSEP